MARKSYYNSAVDYYRSDVEGLTELRSLLVTLQLTADQMTRRIYTSSAIDQAIFNPDNPTPLDKHYDGMEPEHLRACAEQIVDKINRHLFPIIDEIKSAREETLQFLLTKSGNWKDTTTKFRKTFSRLNELDLSGVDNYILPYLAHKSAGEWIFQTIQGVVSRRRDKYRQLEANVVHAQKTTPDKYAPPVWALLEKIDRVEQSFTLAQCTTQLGIAEAYAEGYAAQTITEAFHWWKEAYANRDYPQRFDKLAIAKAGELGLLTPQ